MPSSTFIIIDNSFYSRNADFPPFPSRLAVQRELVQIIAQAKNLENPENELGLIGNNRLLSGLSNKLNDISVSLAKANLKYDGGESFNFLRMLKTATLALKNRANKNNKTNIVMLICSPLAAADTEKQIIAQAKIMRKLKIRLEIVNFGDGSEVIYNGERLRQFIDVLNYTYFRKNNDQPTLKLATSSNLLTIFSNSNIIKKVTDNMYVDYSSVLRYNNYGDIDDFGEYSEEMSPQINNNKKEDKQDRMTGLVDITMEDHLMSQNEFDPAMALMYRISIEESRNKYPSSQKVDQSELVSEKSSKSVSMPDLTEIANDLGELTEEEILRLALYAADELENEKKSDSDC